MPQTLNLSSLLISATLAITGSLIILYLRAIKNCVSHLAERIDRQDAKIDKIEASQERVWARKERCQRDFVDTDQWIRSESYTRRKLDTIAESVSGLHGSLKVIEQMPKVCGQIARDIVKEFNGGQHD